MITQLLSSIIILCLGTLYPAYRSYKALKTRDAREYVKWMMYWIVFAICSLISSFTDIFVSFWFPFYYELKIIIVFYLLSPTTTGSSVLYRRFVHPWFIRHEDRIDDLILTARQESYRRLVRVSSRVAHHASSLALKSVVSAHASMENLFYRDQQGPQGMRSSLLSRSQSEHHYLSQSGDIHESSSRWGWFRTAPAIDTSRRRTEPPGGQFMEEEMSRTPRRRTEPSGGIFIEEEMPGTMRRKRQPSNGQFIEEEFPENLRMMREPNSGQSKEEEMQGSLRRRTGKERRLTSSSISIRKMVEMEEEEQGSHESPRLVEWQSCSSGLDNISAEDDMGSDYGSEVSGGETEVVMEKKMKKKVVSKKKKVKPIRRSLRRFSMTL